MDREQRKTLLHILRNPYGWSEETVRDARLKACDEMERLWRLEINIKGIAQDLKMVASDD